MLLRTVIGMFLAISLAACEDTAPATAPEPETTTEETRTELPEAYRRILAAHGGLDDWQRQAQLSYTLNREDGPERQLIDLRNRREHIHAPNMEMAHDGDSLYLAADDGYEGRPAFYRGLMFYFYAMPWVLADPGVNFAEAEPLTFEGKEYPGLHITYNEGTGASPDDEYFLHYDPASHEMRWLGYTVTFFSGEPSDEVSYIHYPTWTEHDGVALADSLVWYTVEEGRPVAPRSTRRFTEVSLSGEAPADEQFAKPEGAVVVVR